MAKNTSKIYSPLPSITKTQATSQSKEKIFTKKNKDISPYSLPFLHPHHTRSRNNLQHKSQDMDLTYSLVSGNRVETLTSRLLSLQVPKEIIKTYKTVLAVASAKLSEEFISKELLSLSSSGCLVLHCLKSYGSWKESLVTVKEMIDCLASSPGWFKLKEVVNECSSSLSTHILLTLNAAELVLSWKNSIKTELRYKGHVPFIYDSQEFFEEFYRSCDFLAESPISPAFPAVKNDPFLLKICKEVSMDKKNPYNFLVEKNRIFLNINKKVIERIKQVQGDIEKDRELASISYSSAKFAQFKTSELNSGLSEDNQKIAGLFAGRILQSFMRVLLKEIALEVSLEEIGASIQVKILSSVYQIVEEIVKESIMEHTTDISNQKALKLHLINIFESILRNYIEEEITRTNLQDLCETELRSMLELSSLRVRNPEDKRRLTRISMNLETEKMADLVFHSFVEDFTNEQWLVQLVESSIKVSIKKKTMVPLVINNKPVQEIEDFALEVFTPGVHSPNEVISAVTLNESIEIKVSEIETPQKQFSKLSVNLKLIKVEAVNEQYKNIDGIIKEYYLQGINEINYILSPDDIIKERAEYLNTQYYWIMYNNNISGFYCYSINENGLFVVHHLSCINLKFFDELLNNFIEISGLKTDLIFQFKEPVLTAKNVTNFLKKNKFSVINPEKKIKEFLWKSGKNTCLVTKFSLSSICAIETTNAAPYNNKTSQDMIKIGNRHSIISLILSFYSASEELVPNFDESPIRLQQDLNELLEILFSLNFRSYNLISVQDTVPDTDRKPASLFLNLSKSKPTPSLFSCISLSFSLSSCYFTSHFIKNVEYKYFMFTHNIKIKKEQGAVMFIVPTNDPEILVFFIKSDSLKSDLAQGLKLGKTDLFYNIDNLIKAMGEEEMFSQEFWLPCFEVNCDLNLPWIEGYCVNTQMSSFVIANCDERVRLSFKYEGEMNRSLKFEPDKRFCFEDEFVFGVYSMQVLKNLDSPFYSVFVGKENFQMVNN